MTTVLITGARSGLGRDLLKKYLLRPNHTVIGSVRDTSSPDAQSLYSLPKAEGSKLILVAIENRSETSAANAIKEVQSQGIAKLDILIANSAYFGDSAKVVDVPWDSLLKHTDVNVGGTLRIIQASLPLLRAAATPKIAIISSKAGSITAQSQLPLYLAAYGASKVMLNFLAYKLHLEEEDLTVLILHPGTVSTDKARSALADIGINVDEFPGVLTPDESTNYLLQRIDSGTRETASGVFQNYDGEVIAW